MILGVTLPLTDRYAHHGRIEVRIDDGDEARAPSQREHRPDGAPVRVESRRDAPLRGGPEVAAAVCLEDSQVYARRRKLAVPADRQPVGAGCDMKRESAVETRVGDRLLRPRELDADADHRAVRRIGDPTTHHDAASRRGHGRVGRRGMTLAFTRGTVDDGWRWIRPRRAGRASGHRREENGRRRRKVLPGARTIRRPVAHGRPEGWTLAPSPEFKRQDSTESRRRRGPDDGGSGHQPSA